jgi:hypothetical protein
MKEDRCRNCGSKLDSTGRCPNCDTALYTPVKRADEKSPNNQTYKKAAPQRARRSLLDMRTKGFIVGAVALLAVLTLVLCIMGGVFDFGRKEDRVMPNLLGLSEETAVSMLEAIDVRYELKYESSDQSAGLVISQSAEEGEVLSKSDRVTLVISSGGGEAPAETGQMIEVPYVLGKTFEDAKKEIEAQGLRVIRLADEYNDDVPEGQIILQEPEAGSLLPSGEVIKITVSMGPEEEYHITVTAGIGGSVDPKGSVAVKEGESETFTIEANEGYMIYEVKVDGEDIGPIEEYTFEEVDMDHTLYVVFKEIDEVPTETDGDVTGTPSSPSDID